MKIKNNRSVAILMATYNGGRYLAEQIDSIIAQSNEDWTLYIQDDGSSDDTLNIIQKYSSENKQIVNVNVGLSRQGCCNNFMTLLNMVDSKYYMFADQDDIWLPEKVQVSLNKLKEIEHDNPDTPIMVFTDRKFIDQEKRSLFPGTTFDPRKQLAKERIYSVLKTLTTNDFVLLATIAGGNTMLFNQKAKEVSYSYSNIRVHDSNLLIAVNKAHGIIEPIVQVTVLYRLHENQTCGIVAYGQRNKIFNRLFTFFSGNMKMFYIYKLYGGKSIFRFLWYRLRLFYYLRVVLHVF